MFILFFLKAILEAGAIGILVTLAGRTQPELRMNGIWGLMVKLTYVDKVDIKS